MSAAVPPVFELTLPEGALPGNYRFLGMHGGEALGRLFEYQVRFCSDEPAIDALKVLGEKLELSMETADGKRYFNAHATAFEFLGPIDLPLKDGTSDVAQYEYAIVARPWLWFLTRSADCRVFQQKKVPEIIEEILGKYPGLFEKNLSGDYQPWEYCVQYRETDFNFVSRLMEQEGVFYYFAHDESGHKLILVDLHCPTTATKHKLPYMVGERSGRMETEAVRDWRVSREVQAGAYAIKDYDFKRPTAPQLSVVRRPFDHVRGDLEIFDYPGEFDTTGEGDAYVRVRLEELRSQFETIRATCNVRALAAGDVFELHNAEQAGAAAGVKYMVTEATFDLSAGLEHGAPGPRYHCSFACVRAAEPFRPRRTTPRPIVQGPQTATVVGPPGEEIYTDEFGRIKVRFHWDRHSRDENESSCWIRVSQPWAGKGYGSMAIPRIDQEVVVDFLEGDPDRPLVTGRVYNGEQRVPFGLPAAAATTGLKSNTHKGRGYNEMSMDDTAGKEKITIHAQYDMSTTVEHDQTDKINNNRTTTVAKDDKESIGSKQAIDIGADRTLDVGANDKISVGANQDVSVQSNQTVTVGANRSITAGANDEISAAADMKHSAGANLDFSAGVDLGAVGGVNVKISGGATVAVKAGVTLTLSAAGSSIEIGPAGIKITSPALVTVMGATIKLN